MDRCCWGRLLVARLLLSHRSLVRHLMTPTYTLDFVLALFLQSFILPPPPPHLPVLFWNRCLWSAFFTGLFCGPWFGKSESKCRGNARLEGEGPRVQSNLWRWCFPSYFSCFVKKCASFGEIVFGGKHHARPMTTLKYSPASRVLEAREESLRSRNVTLSAAPPRARNHKSIRATSQ